MSKKEILDLKPEERENGEIVYGSTSRGVKRESSLEKTFKKIAGLIVGLALFAVFLTFFFYIVLPLVALILIVILLRKIYYSLIR
jgi:hypothetical protein